MSVLGVGLLLLIATWLVPTSATAAARPALRATPSAAITGEAVTLTARLGVRVARPVRVERSLGKGWTVVRRTTSSASGVVQVRQRVTAPRTAFRVVAPRVVRNGRGFAAITTSTTVVTASPQAVMMAARPGAGGLVDVTVVASHARPDRPVRIKIDTGDGWTNLVTGRLGRSRTLRFTGVAPVAAVSGHRLRAVLAAYDDVAAVASPLQTPPGLSVTATPTDQDVTVTATTTGTVEAVRFYGDGLLIGEDRAAPWSVTWSPRIGDHDVVARAVGPLDSAVSPATMVTTSTVVATTGVLEGFALDEVQSGLMLPTSAASLPSGGVLVTEKGGLVKVVEPVVDGGEEAWSLPRTALDLGAEIYTAADAGLIGVAVDPDFADNGYVYVSYVRDDATEGVDRRSQQVARYTWDGEALDPSSRHVVLGGVTGPACFDEDNIATDDCVPMIGGAHTIGDLGFDDDGNLLVGIGDGSLYLTANGIAGRPEALRVQDPDVLAGKVLRVDPATGHGVPGNPLYAGDGSSNASRVLALGLRNPFRFTVHDDLLVIGDVGEGATEEIDTVDLAEVAEPGAVPPNFGWPCFEGDEPTALGDVDDPDSPWQHCAAVRASAEVRGPSYSYPHEGGGSVSGGTFLDADAYPASLRGRYVFGDYAQNFIRTADVDHHGAVGGVQPFADETTAGGPVKFFTGPDGLVWSVSIMTGSLRRIVWTGDGLEDRCPVGSFRQSFHDLDGPESTFDVDYEGDFATWLPYIDAQLPSAALAPATCVDAIALSSTGSPWLPDDGTDERAHPGDRFGTAWRGRIEVPAGTYRFTVSGSEWVRLWVDGEQVHNFWANGYWALEQHRQHDVELTAGQHTVRAELVHGDDDEAAVEVTWERIGAPPEVSLDLPANGVVAVDGEVPWSISTSDPDGGPDPTVVLEVDFLHYAGNSFHGHPSSRIAGELSGVLEVSDEHAPGSGIVRLRAVATDDSGARSVSAPSYVCFTGGDVGPCA